MYAGVPARPLVIVDDASRTRAMPKSMTRGPSGASSTFSGFRSRCTTPAPWMAAMAVAMPMASRCSASPSYGPACATAARRLGPSTNSLTMYGRSASRSTSRILAVEKDDTRRAAATSFAGGRRIPPGCRTLIATRTPAGSYASYTTPWPPAPMRRASAYAPMWVGSSWASGVRLMRSPG